MKIQYENNGAGEMAALATQVRGLQLVFLEPTLKVRHGNTRL